MKRKIEWVRETRNSCYPNPEQSAAAGLTALLSTISSPPPPPPPLLSLLSPHLFSFRLKANVQVSHASASWAPCELRFCPVAAKTSHFTVKQKGYTHKTNEEKVNIKHLIYIERRHAISSTLLLYKTELRWRPGFPRLLKLCAPRELMQWLFFPCQWTIVSLLKSHCCLPFSTICPSLKAHGSIKWTCLKTMLRTHGFDATWL